MQSWLQFHKNGWLAFLNVITSARRTRLGQCLEKHLKMYMQTVPEKGGVNVVIVRWLGQHLHIRHDQVHLVQGQTQRMKSIFIDGNDAEAIIKLAQL